MTKKRELNEIKKIEASRIAYDFLILQHASIKCVLEQKYDELINVTLFEKFISPNLNRRYSQYTIVAITRAGAILVNQQLLQAFMARKTNWVRRQKLDLKHKEERQKQAKNYHPDLSKLRTVLFWDTKMEKIDWRQQRVAVIKRVFERGNDAEQDEILRFYGGATVDEALRVKF